MTNFQDPINVLKKSLSESVDAGLISQEQADEILQNTLKGLSS